MGVWIVDVEVDTGKLIDGCDKEVDDGMEVDALEDDGRDDVMDDDASEMDVMELDAGEVDELVCVALLDGMR